MLPIQNQIILFLASNGETSKKELRLPFSYISNSWFSQKYRQLIADGYIEEHKGSSFTRVRLTRKGFAYVKQEYPDREIAKNAGKNDYNKRRRKKVISSCRALFAGAGICVSGKRKPPLTDLCSNVVKIQSAAESLFDAALKDGIFYSSGELKALALHLNGADDVSYNARMVGVLFFRHDVFYVYAINGKLSQAYASSENRMVQFIGNCLSNIPAFSRFADRLDTKNSVRRCLVVGTPRGTMTKMFYGTGHGTDTLASDVSAAAMKRLDRWKMSHLTYKNLSSLFSSVFFVPGNAAGVAELRVINGAAGNYRELARKTVAGMKLTPTGACRELCWEPETETNIIPMPYVDMRELDEYYRYLNNRSETATVIAPHAYKDPLSRCFRETLGKFIDCDTMQEEDVFRYLADGTAADTSYMRGLKHTKVAEGQIEE